MKCRTPGCNHLRSMHLTKCTVLGCPCLAFTKPTRKEHTMKRIISTLFVVLALSAPTFAAEPAAKEPVKVPVATCNDGTTMYSSNPTEHRGACSGHKGVKAWADGSPVKSHERKTEYK